MTAPELAAWRRQRGLTQTELAAYLGVTKTSVSRWECGRHPIPSMVTKLLQQLDH